MATFMRPNRLQTAAAAIACGLLFGVMHTLSGKIAVTRGIGYGGDGREGLESQLGGGLRVLHVNHGGSEHIVQYHASSSDAALIQAIAGAVDLTPGTFGLQIEQVRGCQSRLRC